jgi:hypothetical protein
MHSNSVRAIYWIPPGYSVSSRYQLLIDGYFGNVSAAGGSTSNVYYSATQYHDLSPPIAYRSSFLGSVIDSSPFPASGCRDTYTAVCLTTHRSNPRSRV